MFNHPDPDEVRTRFQTPAVRPYIAIDRDTLQNWVRPVLQTLFSQSMQTVDPLGITQVSAE